MVKLNKSLLTELVNQCKTIKGKKDRVQWPERVLDYLERNFYLLPKDLVALRYVWRKGLFGELPTRYIIIYDHERACEHGIVIKGYHDLDNYPDLVLFRGNVFPNGIVQLKIAHT